MIAAFLAPGIVGGPDHGPGAVREFLRIRARLVAENSVLSHRLLRDHFRTSTQMHFVALRTALPDLPDESLRWLYQVLVAALVYTGGGSGTVHSLDEAPVPPADVATVIANHVPLLAELFRAPANAQSATIDPLLAAIGAG